MTAIKISQLSPVTQCKETDTFLTIQDGTNKKVSLSTLLNSLNSNQTVKINPNQNAVSTVIASVSNANLLNIDGVHNCIGVKTAVPDSTTDVDIAGHIKFGGVYRGSVERVTTSAISINTETSLLNSSTTSTFTLSSGYDGQTKIISWAEKNTELFVEVTLSSLLGSETNKKITFNAIGQSVTLKYSTLISKWVCVGTHQGPQGATAITFSA